MGINKFNIVEEVKRFVEEECKKPTSKYGYEPYVSHFIPVERYATRLAKLFGADIEIVQLAVWFHDIGSIMICRENHHVTSCEIAEKKLLEFNYPLDRIKKIMACIYSHRGSQNISRESLEAQILADADAMSCFDAVFGIFAALIVYENRSRREAKEELRKKLINSYKKISSSEARLIIEPKYNAAMLLIGD
jgi:HD superfamily phosphodiesterase